VTEAIQKTIFRDNPFLLGCLFVLYSFLAIGQKHNIINFSTADGLPSQIVNDVFQDNEGFFWFATQDGVCRFNGHDFIPFHPLKALEGVDAVAILQDQKGQICIATNTSGVFIHDFKSTRVIDTKSGLPSNVIRRLFIDRENTLWILTSKGVVKMDGDKIIPITDTKGTFKDGVLSMTQTRNGDLWFGTQGNGLVRLSSGKYTYFGEQDGIQDPYIFSLSAHGDSVLVGTTNSGVYIAKGATITKLAIAEIENAWISAVLIDPRGLYVISSNGLMHKTNANKIELITDRNGLSSNDLYNGYFDREHNLWLTSGNGVSCLRKEEILFFDKASGLSDDKITALCILPNNKIAAGTYGSGITFLNTTGEILGFLNPPELDNVKITCLQFLADRNELWVGTEQADHSLLIYALVKDKFILKKKISKLNKAFLQTITKIETDRVGNIWIGTFNAGLFKLTEKDTIQYSTKNLLPSNEVYTFTIDKKGNPVISLYQKGLFKIEQNRCARIYDEKYLKDKFILSLFEDENGVLFIGTKTNGLVIWKNGSFTIATVKDGLLSNTINAITKTGKKIWVGTNRGFNVLSFDGERLTTLLSLDKRSGLRSTEIQQNALVSIGNVIWAGSTNGLSKINTSQQDLLHQKPIIALKNVKLFFEETNWSAFKNCRLNKHGLPISLDLNHNDNHLSFEFVALTTGAVYYSYYLEGQDKDWTPLSENREVTFSNITPGTYNFKVRSIDNHGVESEVLSIPILIHGPFWQTWWFRTLVILVLIGGTFAIVRIRERTYRERQLILEQTVVERTSEVVQAYDKVEQQRAIVEQKNKEILDSISYAKRIQNAMLPTADLLTEDWKDIFVLYLPKDIVAGDFYWSEKVGEKQLIAVADCTGHGVPGAMVSVVCNNALNRSIREYGLYEPAKLLDKTRALILEEFSKYQEDVNDGMDISIVMFDPEEKQLFWAGANLPLWIIRSNGDFEEVKGDKQPVGKHLREISYTEHQIAIASGDTIYMSTDGYADQFGGAFGKKLKAAQLKLKLSEIHQQPMEEQKQALLHVFDTWKGSHEQVDDVCIVGIRF
jgi:ligand-binding sensor domain-containing protein/serine phosphatase RsbU (regulator of sigma subunit)